MFNSGSGYSLADIAAATGGNGNNGGFGGDNGWWIILLFLLWGENDRKNGNGNGTSSTGAGTPVFYPTATEFNFSGLEAGVRGLQNGLCDGFYAMNTSMLNGFAGVDNAICDLGYQTQQGFNTTNVALMQGQNALATQIADCCCTTSGAIKDASYQTLTGMNAIQTQLASCCCDVERQVERGFADVSYNMATQACDTRRAIADSTRDIIDSNNAGVRSILDFLTQDKIATLTAENQSLKFAASQAAQNAFITANQEAQTAELIRRLDTPTAVPAYVVPNPNCCYGAYGYGRIGCGSCGCDSYLG